MKPYFEDDVVHIKYLQHKFSKKYVYYKKYNIKCPNGVLKHENFVSWFIIHHYRIGLGVGVFR